MNKNQWIRRAEEKGLEGFQINREMSKSRAMAWFDGQMDSFTSSKVISTTMRAIINGKSVSVSLEKVDDDQMDEVLDQLIEAASIVSETEKDELVPVIETEEVASLRHFVRPSMTQVKEFLASLEKQLLAADPRVTMVNELSYEESGSRAELSNSLGVNVHDEVGYQVVSASITMSENGELRDGYEIAVVSDLNSFATDALVKKLVNKVAGTLGASSIKSQNTPVIFNNEAMTTLFGCFSGMFNGDLIAKGISPLSQKVGEKIWSDLVTVIDNPRNQDSLFMQNYDSEGHPTYEKIVVDHGVFETVLHNTRSALKMNSQSTGNGFGGVSAMNMFIVPEKNSLEDLEKKMDRGIVITDLAGMHAGVDFVTTNFSLQARGYLVEGGKKVRPLTLITVAGNFMDLMNKVVAIGNDLDWSVRTLACPSILFSSAAIAGSEKE